MLKWGSNGNDRTHAVVLNSDTPQRLAAMSSAPARIVHARMEALEMRVCMAAGALDPTFGIGGAVTTDFEATSQAEAQNTITLPDGRIVAVGQLGDRFTPSRAVVARFLVDGRPDSTFG